MISRRGVLIGGLAVAAGGGMGWSLWPGEDAAYDQALAENRRRLTAWPEPHRRRMEEIVRHATLAANSHNTQPWIFEATGKTLRIKPDLARRCPVVDPEDRHLIASLGCASENLALAARAGGLETLVAFDASSRQVLVEFDDAAPKSDAAYDAIFKRQSTRAPFDATPLPNDVMHSLENATRKPGVRSRLLTSRKALDELKEFVIAGNTAQCQDPAFVEELGEWLRFNQSHAAEMRDGLYTGSTANPALPRWLGHRLFPLFYTADAENPKYREQLDGSAGAMVLYAERDEPEGWFNIGRAAQRFQLEAAAQDIRTSYINQPVEVAAVRADFTAWLGDGLRPALILRFGRGPTLPFSLRRSVSAVLHFA